jgi:hypothetical protein
MDGGADGHSVAGGEQEEGGPSSSAARTELN